MAKDKKGILKKAVRGVVKKTGNIIGGALSIPSKLRERNADKLLNMSEQIRKHTDEEARKIEDEYPDEMGYGAPEGQRYFHKKMLKKYLDRVKKGKGVGANPFTYSAWGNLGKIDDLERKKDSREQKE